jgi:hypothetical protein
MSEHFDGKFEDPTARSILDDMLGQAIGPDNPMTDKAILDGTETVQARLDRATEIIEGAPLGPDEEYDSEAVAAVYLLRDEGEATRLY